MASISPTFEYELQYWQQGISSLAGIDEVGMGALAGPVVAAAVILPQNCTLEGLNDSKKLSSKKREFLVPKIKEIATTWCIAEASLEEIEKLNIRQASHLAMKRAIEGLKTAPDLLLIDGNPVQIHSSIPTVNIIKGDSLCCSIAAASILAKVYRDNIMKQIAIEMPQYKFDSHKGYASKDHKKALETYGVTPYHRKGYAPIAALLTKKSK
jgi:ribonuclease HII